jgi:hypothetical protein
MASSLVGWEQPRRRRAAMVSEKIFCKRTIREGTDFLGGCALLCASVREFFNEVDILVWGAGECKGMGDVN